MSEAAKAAALASMSSMMSGFGGSSDIHFCPIPTPVPPHGPGVVIDGSSTVLINNMPACTMGCTVLEALGGPDKIVKGEMTVLIGDSGGSGASGGGGGAHGGGGGSGVPAPPGAIGIPDKCAYLKKGSTVESTKADFDRIRGTSRLGAPVAGKHTFPGDKKETDAIIQEIEVKGKKVKVISPKSGAPAG